ncbi:MAG: hypothetical protein HND42_10565 [Armatimonadetes bacterium]|nr:MAG: hypothetical protein EDM73_04335 [Armatimonadota bacterium]MCE7899219.1 hypothetical protein [Armatimonadetes bacterium ATM1]MDL1929002.1 hypothetical protein [Fimbriimonadia bacterium ATM]MBC6969443.1 hypothetical protein [Armatimonadota bacterium]MBL1150637.1 hypothetical protein [Armatimonadota bacterium]
MQPFRNWPQKLAAIAIAIMLFQLVKTVDQPLIRTTIENVTLEARNLPDDLEIAKGPASVRIEVTAKSMQLPDLSEAVVRAYVDVKGAKPGKNTFTVMLDVPGFLRREADFVAKPSTVELELVRVSSRLVRVLLNVGRVHPDYVLDAYSIEPSTVRVVGQESRVNSVDVARVTVDLSSMEPGGAYALKVEALDDDGRPVSVTADPARVTFRPKLEPKPSEKTVLVNPIWTGAARPGYRVTAVTVDPTQVTVRGPAAQLAAINVVETEPIDLSNLRADRTFEARVDLPEGVATSNRNVRVRVTVERIR